MHYQISIAEENDISIILDLQKECYQTEAELHNEYNIPPLTQTLDSIIKEFKGETVFLKAVVDGLLIGSVRGYIDGHTAYLGRLMVKDTFQNKKMGQGLMKEIETHLNTCSRYELFTGFKSVKNINLYQKLGYSECKRERIHDNLELVYLEKVTDKSL
jgi:predicted N-acetyltransferase YhbS